MKKSKASYEVYEKWYDRYAASVTMKEGKLSRQAYDYIHWRSSSRGSNMRDFSRKLAMRQREASELQIRATWGGFKQTLRETKKNLREREKSILDEEIRESIKSERKRSGLKALRKKDLEIEVQKSRRKGISKDVRERARARLSEEMQEEMTFIKEYGSVTWKEFRKGQRKIVSAARSVSEDRSTWDEAFEIAFDSPKEK